MPWFHHFIQKLTNLIGNSSLHCTHQQWSLSQQMGWFHKTWLCATGWGAMQPNGNIKGSRQPLQSIKLFIMQMKLYYAFRTISHLCKKCVMVMKSFSEVSSYSGNWSKFTIQPLCMNIKDVTAQASPYHLPTGCIKKLGRNISPKRLELVHLNFIPKTQYMT